MNKKRMLSLLIFLIFTSALVAQPMGENAAKEILTTVFNKNLPKILGEGKLFSVLDLSTLKIRPGYIKLKGKTKWNLKLGKNNKPIRFKGTISTRFKSFGQSDLKVNFPGDRFLFFPKYQRLSDLVNIKSSESSKRQ